MEISQSYVHKCTATFFMVHSVELELLLIVVLHCRNRDFRLFLLWPDNLHIWTWPIFPGDMPDVQIWTSYVNALESYRLTNIRHTDSTEITYRTMLLHVWSTMWLRQKTPFPLRFRGLVDGTGHPSSQHCSRSSSMKSLISQMDTDKPWNKEMYDIKKYGIFSTARKNTSVFWMRYLVHYRQRFANINWNCCTVNPCIGAEVTKSYICSAVYDTISTTESDTTL